MARVGRVVVMVVVLYVLQGVATTMPYLGLPFEPKPIFLDCYRQAKWDGKYWIETGVMVCLGEGDGK